MAHTQKIGYITINDKIGNMLTNNNYFYFVVVHTQY